MGIMKKLLFILMLLPVFSSAQVIQKNTTYGIAFNRTGADTLLYLPRDTFSVPAAYRTYPFIARKATSLYMWNTSTNVWDLFSAGAATDTTSLSNRINLKLNISDTSSMLSVYLRNAGYGLLKSGQTVSLDTTVLSQYLSGGDTTIFSTVLDSTGQLQHRVLFAGGNNRIKSNAKFLFDSTNIKLGINVNNISQGGPNTKLFVGGNATVNGTFTATTLVKSGGTSSQFLKADGSVDANTYLTAIPTLQQVLDAGSTLTSNETIITGTNTFDISSNNSSTAVTLSATSANVGLSVSSANVGISISSSGGGAGVQSTTTNSTTNSVLDAEILRRSVTSGSGAAGVGVRTRYEIENSSGTTINAGGLAAKLTTATASSEVTQFDFTGLDAGSSETFMNIQASGVVRVNNLADTLATKAYARSVGGGGTNIGNSDLTLAGNRVLDADGFTFDLTNSTQTRFLGSGDFLAKRTSGAEEGMFSIVGDLLNIQSLNASANSYINVRPDSITLVPDGGILNIASLTSVSDTTNYKPIAWNPTTGRVVKHNYWPSGTGGTVSFGTDNQIPYTNAGGTDFDYSANFTFTGSALHVDGSAVFNESGADVDFRIEGDTDPNAFFVDGTNNRIGVGTNAPEDMLHMATGSLVFGNGFGFFTTSPTLREAGQYFDGGNMVFRVNNVENIVYLKKSNQYVGINTNAPDYQLDVNGVIRGRNHLLLNDITAPSTPASGTGALYTNTDQIWFKDDGGGVHRLANKQGADIASVAGAISLGADGNTFEITGTNAITLISNVGFANGAEITLIFMSTATLTDGTANSGTDIGMELAGNTNFTASADDVITLVLSEVGGTQRWREKSRSVN